MAETPIDALDLNRFLQTFRPLEGFAYSAFMQLVEDTGEDTTLRIIARYNETLREVLGHITEGLASEDAEKIWRACHKIAGSSELVGFADYGHRARALSHQVKAAPQASDYFSEINKFRLETEALVARLENTQINFSNLL